MYHSSVRDECGPKDVSTSATEAVEAEIKKLNDFNALSTAEEDILDLSQTTMMANIATRALSESKFKTLRDMITGNKSEDNQREHSESTYSFLMLNVTDKGYESEGGESEEAMGQEQSLDHSVIQVTSSANESSSIANESSTIANESNPYGNESSSITDEVVDAVPFVVTTISFP
jgi:hypothetical protein